VAPKRAKVEKGTAQGLGAKVPRSMPAVGDGTHPIFSFRYLDRTTTGAFGWHLHTDASFRQVMTFMVDVSASSWSELRGQRVDGRPRNHSQEIATLCPEAQQLLARGPYDGLGGDLFRFRLMNAARLWGYKFDEVFYVLWWDPEHRVYPLEPR
jgi:hypothetical protein